MGGVSFHGKKHYKSVRFNVISVKMGWVGVKFPGKKRYGTLEWPLSTRVGNFVGFVLLGDRNPNRNHTLTLPTSY